MTTQASDHNRLKTLVSESLGQQQGMVDLLRELQRLLSSQSYATLPELNERLGWLQSQTKATDQQLNEAVAAAASLPPPLPALLERRTALQQQALQLTTSVLSGAKSVKSLLANEMQAIRHGRVALTGYRPAAVRDSRLVNHST